MDTTLPFRCLWLILILLSFSACSEVKAWDKKFFNEPHMAFEPDALEGKFFRHVYESKEASAGGYGVSAAGCGCN